jgi:predicted TIM-barrel fold metal-dependent hydrolase
MQDPEAATQELTRCVKELGFCGALVHAFSQTDEADSAVFYDLPQYRPCIHHGNRNGGLMNVHADILFLTHKGAPFR